MVAGSVSCATRLTAPTASPNETPDLRLKEIVTEGSGPVWGTVSGPVARVLAPSEERGALRRVGVLERVLVLALRQAPAEADGRRHLEERADPDELRQLRAQVGNDLVGRMLALRSRLQLREHDPGVADADVAAGTAA